LGIERSKGEVAATPDLSKIFALLKAENFILSAFLWV
jgi:hypothetical protein